MRETSEGDLKAPGEDEDNKTEETVVHTEGNTRMVVHNAKAKDSAADDDDDETLAGPDVMKKLEDVPTETIDDDTEDLMADNIVDMATAVAMEMEDKRRNEEWEKMKTEQKKQELERIQSEADALA